MAVTRKFFCRVDQVIDHGHHVYTVDLIPDNPLPRFRQGQFLHFALDNYESSGFWPDSRVFSIANSPSQRDRLRITYSVVGCFTTRMEQEIEVGRGVWTKLPYGDFFIDDSKDAVLVAGGTGITAFTSFLDSLTNEYQQRIYLAYGARTWDLLIYQNLVQQCVKTVPRLRAFYFIEQGIIEKSSDGRGSDEFVGRISLDAIWPQIQRPFEANFYLSGPPQMIKAISQDLRDRSVQSESIRIDAWE